MKQQFDLNIQEKIEKRIFIVPAKKIMFDKDLAGLYAVPVLAFACAINPEFELCPESARQRTGLIKVVPKRINWGNFIDFRIMPILSQEILGHNRSSLILH